jgi:hypothetical protein
VQPNSYLVPRADVDGVDRSLEDHVNAVVGKDRADRLGDIRVLSSHELGRIVRSWVTLPPKRRKACSISRPI